MTREGQPSNTPPQARADVSDTEPFPVTDPVLVTLVSVSGLLIGLPISFKP